FPAAARYVTPDGIVIEPDGRVAAGPLDRSVGLISRRSELRDLTTELERVAAKISDLNEQQARADTEQSQLESSITELQRIIHDPATQRAEAAATLASVDGDVGKLSAEQPQIAQEATEIARLMAETSQRQQASRDSLGQVEQQNAQREQLIAKLQTQIEE